MNKPKFSVKKARKAVEISSKIEGHKIRIKKTTDTKKTKLKIKK